MRKAFSKVFKRTVAAERPEPRPLTWDFGHLPLPRVDGPVVRYLERNERGRDIVVGDVHGQRETFECLLEKVRYSPAEGDRLLMLGDLIDRGPDSPGMLEWLRRDDVVCIRGNHEQLMLDALTGSRMFEELWMDSNGGAWAEGVDRSQFDEWQKLVQALPLALEVEGAQGTFVLVHAEIPQETPWWAFRAWLEDAWQEDPQLSRVELEQARLKAPQWNARIIALWHRRRVWNKRRKDKGVPDVWRTFHGHTPLHSLMQLRNMRWIDLGAAYANHRDDAALACVPIGPDGKEQEPVVVKVLDVDPDQKGRPIKQWRGRWH